MVTTTTKSEIRVVESNTIDELHNYRDAWDELLSHTPNASFFQTLDWLSVYWKHFGAGQQLRTLLVFDGEQLAGVLPLAERATTNRLGTIQVLAYPLDNWGTRYGPVGFRSESVLGAGIAWLADQEAATDAIEFNWVDEAQVESVTAAFDGASLATDVTPRTVVSEIDLSDGWESYWASRSSKHRNNVRRAKKQLGQLGAIKVLHHCGAADPRWDLYEMCEDVASQSWQGDSTTGNTLTHGCVAEFLREVHQIATDRSAVSLHVVLVAGRPAAFAYNYLFADRLFALRMGYRSDLSAAGPGSYLIEQVIREAARRGIRTIDLGEGDAAYKHRWRTHKVATFRVCHYRRFSLLAQAMRLKRHWSRAFRAIL